MKRILMILLCLPIATSLLWAQEVDCSFVFVDEHGAEIENGAIIVRNLVENFDETAEVIYSGLSVLNVSASSSDYIRVNYTIERIDNGSFQLCFPITCNTQTMAGVYQTSPGHLNGDLQDLQCEWFTSANGTCLVTMTIELLTRQSAFPPSYVHKAFGPSVTVQFVKGPSASNDGSPYVKLADGVYLDGSTLYICSGVTSLGNLQINPSEIYCYAAIPPACMANTFTAYDAILHVPAASMVSYFTTLYWYNFNNILSDAIEPQSLTMNTTETEVEVDQQLTLSATVAPSNATPKTVYWSSTDLSVATVSNDGTVTAVSAGECDILATCVDKVAVCHLTVVPPRVTITLDKHEARLLPNHTLTLTATCLPVNVDLAVTSSNPAVAIPRLVNGTIMVVGVAEGTATITVNAADGCGNPDACEVTVYTELGDVDCDGYVSISDATRIIDYLLNGDPDVLNTNKADIDNDGMVSISDVTTLIDYLLSGIWPWEQPITYTVNGVSFKMIPVKGGTFMIGATTEQGDEFEENEQPIHMVSLSDYSIGETEVTQSLWQAVMGSNPSNFKDPNRPVEGISWYRCQEFIAKLNQMTGKNFRLPTEAEWEFAARGGNKSKSYKYAGSNTIDDVGYYIDNCEVDDGLNFSRGTHVVAMKAPNELGLYDMSGNVEEWCHDVYGVYSSENQINPTGPIVGDIHVYRGGGWLNDASACRVSSRNSSGPMGFSPGVGLRLALGPGPEVEEHECVDLGLPSGTLWATCNVGACSPEEYGDYFAWGETEPKDVYNWSTYKWWGGYNTFTKYCIDSSYGTVDNKTELDPEDDAAYVNWDSSWRMPTLEQISELCNSCTWKRATRNGVNGSLATGPNGNTIFLPAAGYRLDGTFDETGSVCRYWSSTLASGFPDGDTACFLYVYFMSDYAIDYYAYYRYSGNTVRAVRVSQN